MNKQEIMTVKIGAIIESQCILNTNFIKEIDFNGRRVYLLNINELDKFIILDKKCFELAYNNKEVAK